MSYEPRPGTIAFRALALLEVEGREMNTSQIAEALGVSATNLAPSLEAPIKHGLLLRRQRFAHVRAPFWYRLPKQEATTTDEVPPPPPPPPPTRPVEPAASRVFAPTPEPKPKRKTGPKAAPDAAPAALVGRNATLSMSGELAIVAECGTVVLFDAERVRQLLAFLAGRAA